MARIMHDSVNWRAIPESAEMVAGYLSPSKYAWPAEAWNRFPHAVQVRIAVRATTNAGHVLDVETGDASPEEAPRWVQMRRAAGADPSVYCSRSLWSTVMAAFRSAGVAYPHWWVAQYDGVRAIPAGAVAKQFADYNAGSGGDWDLSIVADYWPGVDQGESVSNITEDTQSYEDMVRRIGMLEGFLNADPNSSKMALLLLDAIGRIEGIFKNGDQTFGPSRGPNTNKLAPAIAAPAAVTLTDTQLTELTNAISTRVAAALPPGGASKEDVHQVVSEVIGSIAITVTK